MATENRPVHFKNYSDFNTKKLSANEDNTTYTVGIDGVLTSGTPEINYQQVCWIKDTQQIWTHGQIYNCSGGSGSNSGSSEGIIPLNIALCNYFIDGSEMDLTVYNSSTDIANKVQTYLGAVDNVNNNYDENIKYQWSITLIGGADYVYSTVTPSYISVGDDNVTLYYKKDGIKLYSVTLKTDGTWSSSEVSGGTYKNTWDGNPIGGGLYDIPSTDTGDVLLTRFNFLEADTCCIAANASQTVTFTISDDDLAIGDDAIIYVDDSVGTGSGNGKVVYCIQCIGTNFYITMGKFNDPTGN